MKYLLTSKEVVIPEGGKIIYNYNVIVTITTKSRIVKVKGKMGEITKNFKHLNVDLKVHKNKKGDNILSIEMWFGTYKQRASVTTLASLIENMITGVQKVKFQLKKRGTDIK